jgi:hypothetical protein
VLNVLLSGVAMEVQIVVVCSAAPC